MLFSHFFVIHESELTVQYITKLAFKYRIEENSSLFSSNNQRTVFSP